VLGGKSSVNKRELAEAMAQRASEQVAPWFDTASFRSPLLEASEISALLRSCASGDASSFIVSHLGGRGDGFVIKSPVKSTFGSPSRFDRDKSINISTIVNFSQTQPDPLFVHLTPPDIAHAVT
jgi:hypothetical protein